MTRQGPRRQLLLPTVVLACVLWFFTLSLDWLNFWVKISVSAGVLAALAIAVGTLGCNRLAFDRTAFYQGVLSAALLYAVFWLGYEISSLIFPFAPEQVGAIYGKGEGVPRPVVFLLLLILTGPCEEIYWRGYLQRSLMERRGPVQGWLMATAIYAGVHLFSLNFMLVGAAAVGGAFWGLLYLRLGRLGSLIISHSIWSAFIFAVAPVS